MTKPTEKSDQSGADQAKKEAESGSSAKPIKIKPDSKSAPAEPADKSEPAKAEGTKDDGVASGEAKAPDTPTDKKPDKDTPSVNGKSHGAEPPAPEQKAKTEAKPAATPKRATAAPTAGQGSVAGDKVPRGRGLGTFVLLLIAAVLGGLIVQYVLPLTGVLRAPGATDGRIQTLSDDVAGLRSALEAADLAGLRERLAELEANLAVLGGPTGEGEAAGLDPSGVADLRSRIQAAVELIGRLTARVERLEVSGGGAVEGGATAGDASQIQTLSSQLQSDITGIRSRLDALTGALNQRSSALTDRVQAVETRVPSDLGEQLSAFASKNDVEGIVERLAALEQNTAAMDAKRAAAAIALANLSRTASLGQPFSRELDAVRLVGADGADVEALAALADQGIRPTAELLADFDEVRRSALRAAGAAGGSWWDRLLANLSNLFSIRRRGPMDGDSVEAVVSRADDAARAGNLQGAVAELATLEGPPAEAAQAWVAEGRARLELDRLITTLSGRLLQDLAP